MTRARIRSSLAMLLALVLAPAAHASSAADEYALKAAFLYNFTRFVDWPPDAFPSGDGAFRICVFGTDPFGARLDALARRRVGTRPIEIVKAGKLVPGLLVAHHAEPASSCCRTWRSGRAWPRS